MQSVHIVESVCVLCCVLWCAVLCLYLWHFIFLGMELLIRNPLRSICFVHYYVFHCRLFLSRFFLLLSFLFRRHCVAVFVWCVYSYFFFSIHCGSWRPSCMCRRHHPKCKFKHFFPGCCVIAHRQKQIWRNKRKKKGGGEGGGEGEEKAKNKWRQHNHWPFVDGKLY